VLFAKRYWDGLADGTVRVAFRRWQRPTVRTGGTLQSPVGLLAIDRVETVDPAGISDQDAESAGHRDREDLLAALDRHSGDEPRATYRIDFHLLGDDPRIALRADADLDREALTELRARLARMDAPRAAPWTTATLQGIRDHPGLLAEDLARSLGREKHPFKADVRRLKALGLTESLPVGYRLSPRGEAVLRHLEEHPG
jgi:hypothetical protein